MACLLWLAAEHWVKQILWEHHKNSLQSHCRNQKTTYIEMIKTVMFLWIITLRKSSGGCSRLNGCPCGPCRNSIQWIRSVNILFLCEQHATKSSKTNKEACIKHDHFQITILFPQPRQRECNQMLLLWLFVDSWSHPSPSREAGRGGHSQAKVGGGAGRKAQRRIDSTWPFGD